MTDLKLEGEKQQQQGEKREMTSQIVVCRSSPESAYDYGDVCCFR